MTRAIGNFRDKRIEWLDSAKGIVIILMLYGHFDNIPCMVKSVIYSFHMPFFFILSGYFIDKKTSTKHFIIKKIKQLLYPYLLGGLLLIIFQSLQSSSWVTPLVSVLYGTSGAGCTILNYYVQPVGPLWFLWGLFWALIIVQAYLHFFSRPLIAICIFTLLAYGAVKSASHLILPFSIQQGLNGCIFVYLGFIARERDLLHRACSSGRVLIPLAIFVWVASFTLDTDIHQMTLMHHTATLYFITTSTSATFIIVAFCKYLCKLSLITNCISKIGKSTLCILCLHGGTYFFIPRVGMIYLLTCTLIILLSITIRSLLSKCMFLLTTLRTPFSR